MGELSSVVFVLIFIGFLLRLIYFDFLIWHLFGFYLEFLRGFVLWKLHEIKLSVQVVFFCVPGIFC